MFRSKHSGNSKDNIPLKDARVFLISPSSYRYKGAIHRKKVIFIGIWRASLKLESGYYKWKVTIL